jgi:hypothetical protein
VVPIFPHTHTPTHIHTLIGTGLVGTVGYSRCATLQTSRSVGGHVTTFPTVGDIEIIVGLVALCQDQCPAYASVCVVCVVVVVVVFHSTAQQNSQNIDFFIACGMPLFILPPYCTQTHTHAHAHTHTHTHTHTDWHLVDSQSFPFDSPTYPELGRLGKLFV